MICHSFFCIELFCDEALATWMQNIVTTLEKSVFVIGRTSAVAIASARGRRALQCMILLWEGFFIKVPQFSCWYEWNLGFLGEEGLYSMALHPGPQWLPQLTRWQALIAGYYNHDFRLHNHLAMGEDLQ
jgi:hypothetical protein